MTASKSEEKRQAVLAAARDKLSRRIFGRNAVRRFMDRLAGMLGDPFGRLSGKGAPGGAGSVVAAGGPGSSASDGQAFAARSSHVLARASPLRSPPREVFSHYSEAARRRSYALLGSFSLAGILLAGLALRRAASK